MHNFFLDWISPITYETVDEPQQHIDKAKRPTPVDLVADARTGLYLCPCDITAPNFKKFEDGTVVALDFGATCFLPPVFFAVAVRKSMGNFAWKVAKRVHYPKLSDVSAIWRPLISRFPSEETT